MPSSANLLPVTLMMWPRRRLMYGRTAFIMATAPPMQYLKSTRLHQARLLMVRNGITAAAASVTVGYDSPSQFSREFKRLFGRSPVEEVKRMKAEFAVPPAQARSIYISSH